MPFPIRKKLCRMLPLCLSLGTLCTSAKAAESTTMPAQNIYDFTVKTIEGESKSLADYRGKVLLIVNTASKCGFTDQYKGLELLYDTYKSKGFEVLGFPANNFLRQEPGSDADIKSFCSLTYNVTFPLFSKISVRGKDIDPLYAYLTKDSAFSGAIQWNFTKFLVNREGIVIARFGPRTDPAAPELQAQLKAALS